MTADLKLVATGDGSVTIYSENFGQHYHSVFGAITESTHIFLNAGLNGYLDHIQSDAAKKKVSILEVGLGSGLNCLLTLSEAKRLNTEIEYTAIEPFPVDEKIWSELGFITLPGLEEYKSIFAEIHRAPSGSMITIRDSFRLKKQNTPLESTEIPETAYHIIYFDAFSPDSQPGMWTEEIFFKLFRGLKPGGILVTYCVKGTVVRAMRSVGFTVEKLPGPPGKRHILRAVKISPCSEMQ
jgi:tRNA U34 5-methylaminomethyl-2-thiouridine-forming methyltransferase MnmC